jgi:hypothetical protein
MRFKSDAQRRAVMAKFSAASDLVEKMKGFVSTRAAPSPSFLTGDQQADLAAVVAGSKPAALVPEEEGERQKELLDMAKDRGLTIKEIEDIQPDYTFKSYIVGVPENVKKISDIEDIAGNVPLSDKIITDDVHRDFGNALGYTPVAIEDFIEATHEKTPYGMQRVYLQQQDGVEKTEYPYSATSFSNDGVIKKLEVDWIGYRKNNDEYTSTNTGECLRTKNLIIGDDLREFSETNTGGRVYFVKKNGDGKLSVIANETGVLVE